VVEFEGDELTIRIPAGRLARSKADRQRVLALLTVATDRVAYGIQEVPASRVNAICDDYSCLDQNVPQNVARGGLLARRGKRGAYTYRATQPGLERAKTLLKELVEGDGALRL
jgi:hypothetical protein